MFIRILDAIAVLILLGKHKLLSNGQSTQAKATLFSTVLVFEYIASPKHLIMIQQIAVVTLCRFYT